MLLWDSRGSVELRNGCSHPLGTCTDETKRPRINAGFSPESRHLTSHSLCCCVVLRVCFTLHYMLHRHSGSGTTPVPHHGLS